MKKETIIFLHGIVGNKNAFRTEINELQESYNCISYDYVGYNSESLGKEVPYSLDILIEQLYEVYQTANAERAHLCALSFGGFIASAFAQRYPEKVISITLSGGYCNTESKFKKNLLQLIKEKDDYSYEGWLKRYASLMNPNKKEVNDDSEGIFFSNAVLLHPSVFEKAINIQLDFPSASTLTTLKQPVLWLMGEYDELHIGTLQNLTELIPHVEYREIKGAGHVVHIHQPEIFMYFFKIFLLKNKEEVKTETI